MCLIAYTPTVSSRLTYTEITKAFASNGDGAGLMFSDGKTLTIDKGLFTVDEFCEAYYSIPDSYPVVSHFRWATHGKKNSDNCHPFALCEGRVGMVHNGILPSPESGESDTKFWADTVFWGRRPGFLMSHAFRDHVEKVIGYNKIVLMDSAGKVSILNANQGVQKGDRWLSNSCLTDVMTRVYGSCLGLKQDGWAYEDDDRPLFSNDTYDALKDDEAEELSEQFLQDYLERRSAQEQCLRDVKREAGKNV